MAIADRAALILIDIQKGLEEYDFYGGNRNNPDAENNMAKLLSLWRKLNYPIIHIKHNSTNPDSPLAKGKPGNQIKDIVSPQGEEPIIEKNVNSAFIGTDLKERLESLRIKNIVVVGLTTEHCISTSVRMASNLGFKTILVSDATAAFDKVGIDGSDYPAELVHKICLASLKDEFAKIMTTMEVFSLVEEGIA